MTAETPPADTATETETRAEASPKISAAVAARTELERYTSVPLNFAERERMAHYYLKSDLVPEALRSVPNLLIAMQYAIDLNEPLTTILGAIHLIKGKVAWNATFARARVRRPGGHSLRITAKTAERAEITIKRHDEDEPYVVEFTMDEAIAAGMVAVDPKTKQLRATRNPNWTAYAKAMLVARASTIAVREVCPEVMGGTAIYTPGELGGEEVDENNKPIRIESQRVAAEHVEHEPDPETAARERWRTAIETADAEQLARAEATAVAKNLLANPLYEDGTTVAEAIEARRIALRVATPPCDEANNGAHDDVEQEAEVLADEDYGPPIADAPSDVPVFLPPATEEEEYDAPPKPDHPDLCRDTPERRGFIAALRAGGDVEALVDVEYGLPLHQVSTRKLQKLLIHNRPSQP